MDHTACVHSVSGLQPLLVAPYVDNGNVIGGSREVTSQFFGAFKKELSATQQSVSDKVARRIAGYGDRPPDLEPL